MNKYGSISDNEILCLTFDMISKFFLKIAILCKLLTTRNKIFLLVNINKTIKTHSYIVLSNLQILVDMSLLANITLLFHFLFANFAFLIAHVLFPFQSNYLFGMTG